MGIALKSITLTQTPGGVRLTGKFDGRKDLENEYTGRNALKSALGKAVGHFQFSGGSAPDPFEEIEFASEQPAEEGTDNQSADASIL